MLTMGKVMEKNVECFSHFKLQVFWDYTAYLWNVLDTGKEILRKKNEIPETKQNRLQRWKLLAN